MSARFGHDFSSVRIHTDADAAGSAQALGAAAFTQGQDIFFGGGFQPGDPANVPLLAHELTHVVQQARHGSGDPERVSNPHDAAEQEADALAAQVTAGQSVSVTAAPSAGISCSFLGKIKGGLSGAIHGVEKESELGFHMATGAFSHAAQAAGQMATNTISTASNAGHSLANIALGGEHLAASAVQHTAHSVSSEVHNAEHAVSSAAHNVGQTESRVAHTGASLASRGLHETKHLAQGAGNSVGKTARMAGQMVSNFTTGGDSSLSPWEVAKDAFTTPPSLHTMLETERNFTQDIDSAAGTDKALINRVEDASSGGAHWAANQIQGVPVLNGLANYMAYDVASDSHLAGGFLKGAVTAGQGLLDTAIDPYDAVTNWAKGDEDMAEHIPGLGLPTQAITGLANVATGGESMGQFTDKLARPPSLQDDARFWWDTAKHRLDPYSDDWKHGRRVDAAGEALFDIASEIDVDKDPAADAATDEGIQPGVDAKPVETRASESESTDINKFRNGLNKYGGFINDQVSDPNLPAAAQAEDETVRRNGSW